MDATSVVQIGEKKHQAQDCPARCGKECNFEAGVTPQGRASANPALASRLHAAHRKADGEDIEQDREDIDTGRLAAHHCHRTTLFMFIMRRI